MLIHFRIIHHTGAIIIWDLYSVRCECWEAIFKYGIDHRRCYTSIKLMDSICLKMDWVDGFACKRTISFLGAFRFPFIIFLHSLDVSFFSRWGRMYTFTTLFPSNLDVSIHFHDQSTWSSENVIQNDFSKFKGGTGQTDLFSFD